MEAVINDYISREVVEDPDPLPLGNATPLMETGMLPGHSASVDAICAYSRSRAGAGRTGARG